MRTVTCPICGTQFDTAAHNKKYCSARCAKKGEVRSRMARYGAKVKEIFDSVAETEPVSFDNLSRARTKPANTSAVRWRIELRRRATAKQYGRKCIWDCRPNPDLLH